MPTHQRDNWHHWSPRDGPPKECIAANPDVFSYATLCAPSERKKHNSFTVDAGMSYGLVGLTLIIQAILLYCVYHKVIDRNTNWRNGILSTGKGNWNLITTHNNECYDGKSLCRFHNGTYSCAPPSVQLVGQWHELDLNNDGVWTMDEVHTSREDVKCKYAVDPVEFFAIMIELLKERAQLIWLHPDVQNGKAIPSAYFTYIMGDVAMCGYRNEDMCGNLLKRGVFDAPLNNVSVPRVGSSIRSVLEYCHTLLDKGGLCERLLPSSYSTWRIESVQECGEPNYNTFIKSAADGSFKSLLEVDYEAREEYSTAKTSIFIAYKTCIVFVWLLLNISRMREVLKSLAWLCSLPSIRNKELEEHDQVVHSEEIHFISMLHKIVLGIVLLLRSIMLVVLLYVGLNFLGRQTGYIDLLLDGVALIFVLDVATILYHHVLREQLKQCWEERDPIETVKFNFTPLASRPDLEDVMFLSMVVALSFLFMVYYNWDMVNPLYDALQCACVGEGESCQEASKFSNSWWSNYWSHEIPSSIKDIKALGSQHVGKAMLNPRKAANLLKHQHRDVHLRHLH